MKTYGLIGWPLSHSWSPKFFAEKFKKEGIAAEYKLFPLKSIDQLPALLHSTSNLCGLNVTIPYKTSVVPFLDELSPEAQKIGAVNTISISGGKLTGHNTDAYGFAKTLETVHRENIRGALILGTGGASRAVGYVLGQYGIASLKVSRLKADALAYTDITAALLQRHNLIVNCTPAGMFPLVEEKPPIDTSMFSKNTILIDLIYNPLKTRLMLEAEVQGAQVLNGLKMLHSQAERAWEIWQA